MGPGLTALLVFIALIIIWAVVLKRNIVEAAILSLIILPFFGGVDQAPSLMSGAIKYVLNYEVCTHPWPLLLWHFSSSIPMYWMVCCTSSPACSGG